MLAAATLAGQDTTQGRRVTSTRSQPRPLLSRFRIVGVTACARTVKCGR